jgi:hypothetical protein
VKQMEFMDDMYDTGMDALDTAMDAQFLGGVGGIIAGAMVGGFLSSVLSFSGRVGRFASSAAIFLSGAGLYGYGLSGRVAEPALRSLTQVSGIVVGGIGLGRLLADIGLPSFGLGAEELDDNGRVIGQDYEGKVVGQWSGAAEDESAANQGFMWDWKNGEDGVPTLEESRPEDYNPAQMMATAPSWASGASAVSNPWATAERSNLMSPSAPMGGVDQWYGSAEEMNFSPKRATLGNMVMGAEGLGSVIGQ